MLEFKTKKKKIGLVKGTQLSHQGNKTLWRLPSVGENGTECVYELWKEGPALFYIMHPIYFVICINCGEKMELDVEEYTVLIKIAKLNKKLKSGHIDTETYQMKLDTILKKL